MGRDGKSTHWRWIAVGAAAVVVSLILLVVVLRRPPENLTLQRLQSAEERWNESRVADYDLKVVVSGVQKGVHQIKVRGGRVVAMTTGGAEVPEHVWPRWTVEGLFDFLREELANAEDPENTYGVADPSQIVLYAGFDPENGHPRRFLRHVMGRQASVEWRVEEFAPQASEKKS